MARKKSSDCPSSDEPSIDISSMIDVCFLLLIYFLVTCTIAPRETDLAIALPSLGVVCGEMPPIPPMMIRVDGQGAIFSGSGAGEQPLDIDISSREVPLLVSQLGLYRDAAISAGTNPFVQINIDEQSSQQRVVDVLNALGGTGIAMVAFTDFL